MNLAEKNSSPPGEKKEKISWWNVLLQAQARRLYKQNNNPSKISAPVKLMYSFGRNQQLFTP